MERIQKEVSSYDVQVEVKEVMEAMISRQDMLVKEVTQLRSQVQKLMHRQASESYLQ